MERLQVSLVSQLMRLNGDDKRRAVPQRRRQPKLLRGKSFIPTHAPYTHTPPPRSSSSRPGGKKNVPGRLMEKCLTEKTQGEKGRERDRQREGERESARMEGLHRHFPRLRAVTYNPQCVHRGVGGAQTEQEQARALQAPGKMSRRMLRCN